MLLRAKESGAITAETKTLIEWSSGNTVLSLGALARMMGIDNVKANMSNKTSQAKIDLLRFFVSQPTSSVVLRADRCEIRVWKCKRVFDGV